VRDTSGPDMKQFSKTVFVICTPVTVENDTGAIVSFAPIAESTRESTKEKLFAEVTAMVCADFRKVVL
jgi:hypothetical protein